MDASQPVTSGLFLTTSWVYGTGDYSYSRNQGPNFTDLRHQIQELYASESTILCCSGMAAISCVLHGLLEGRQEPILLIDSELYCDTIALAHRLKMTYPTLTLVQTNLTADLPDLEPTLILSESCSNPSGRMIDIPCLRSKYPNAIIAIDNSWLSIQYQPMLHGADLIVESLSKYMGAGDVIGGFVTGQESVMRYVRDYAKSNGVRLSAYDAYTVNHNLPTLDLCLERLGKIALIVAQYLEEHGVFVKYPGLASHPSYKLAQQHNVLPGTLLFLLSVSRKEALRRMKACRHMKCATSYGKSVTLLDPYIKSGTAADGTKGIYIRLSVGYGEKSVEAILQELTTIILQ